MKNKIILLGSEGRPTMNSLFTLFNNPEITLLSRVQTKNKEYLKRFENSNLEHFTKAEKNVDLSNSIIIRWGIRMPVIGTDLITYNTNNALALASDKAQCRSVLQNANVRTPRLVSPENINEAQYPVIARPYKHSQGRNFVVLRDYGSFKYHYDKNRPHNWYYSEFIDKSEEYRVHCAHGKIQAIMQKPAPENNENIAWNRCLNDEGFSLVRWADWNIDVCLQALKAMQAIELDFGGVDIMVKDGLAYVLEINSSPMLSSSPFVAAKYVKYFNWLFRSESVREHFNFSKFTRIESFSWKDFNYEDRTPKNKN